MTRRHLAFAGSTLITGVVASMAVATSVPADAPVGAFAPPPTSTTTTTAPIQVIAPPTTTSTTTTTTTPVIAQQPPTTTTTTTIPTVAQQPPTTTTTTTTEPSAELITTTAAPAIVQQPPTTTIPTAVAEPPAADGPVPLGGWSTDPDDWSDEVQEYLQAEGFDLDALANQNATIGGPSDQLLSNEGCAVNCITSGLMWAVGVGAYLEVTTSVPAIISIDVLDAGLKGPPLNWTGKVWGATWPHLQPNTTYQALARAIDINGNIAVASGEFTTLSRYAKVTLTPTAFTLWNPPGVDPWADYDWEYKGEAWLNDIGKSAEGTPQFIYPKASMASSVITVKYLGTIDDPADDGCSDPVIGPNICPAVGSSDDVSGSEPGGSYYGQVATEIQLDGYPDDETSWTGHEFTFPLNTFWGAPQKPPFYLAIDVTVQVWYQ